MKEFGHGFGHGSVTVLATIAGMLQSSLIFIDLYRKH